MCKKQNGVSGVASMRSVLVCAAIIFLTLDWPSTPGLGSFRPNSQQAWIASLDGMATPLDRLTLRLRQ
jgi:hypothetical protein